MLSLSLAFVTRRRLNGRTRTVRSEIDDLIAAGLVDIGYFRFVSRRPRLVIWRLFEPILEIAAMGFEYGKEAEYAEKQPEYYLLLV